jgi:hypothetical protein
MSDQQISQLMSDQTAAISAVDSNPELTTEAKESRKQAIRETYTQEFEQIRAEERAQLEQNLERTRSAVYKLPLDAGSSRAESAQVYSAFCNAWSDVEFATTGENVMNADETLNSMLCQAYRVGDELAAGAAYHRALDLGIESVIEKYHAKHPGAAKKHAAYLEAKDAMDASRGFTGLIADSMNRSFFG